MSIAHLRVGIEAVIWGIDLLSLDIGDTLLAIAPLFGIALLIVSIAHLRVGIEAVIWGIDLLSLGIGDTFLAIALLFGIAQATLIVKSKNCLESLLH